VNSEIARLRVELGKTRDIEPHHAVPRQFARQAERAGIDIEDYVFYMDTPTTVSCRTVSIPGRLGGMLNGRLSSIIIVTQPYRRYSSN
jgi:hypothetical protein